MYQLSKDFRFESAHRLAKNYPGKCKNIHGHSWNGVLTVEIGKLDKYDFGIDYAELGKIIKPIEDLLDHGILLNESDKDLIKLCMDNDWKILCFSDNPTCEVIAKWIYGIVFSKLEIFPKVKLVSIEIKETCTSSCVYYE